MSRKVTPKPGAITTLLTGDHISLRAKALAGKQQSLFLAIHRPGSKREYRFLDLRLTGVKDDDDETLAEARAIMFATEKDLRAERRGIVAPSKAKAGFLEYFDSIALKHESRSTRQSWQSARVHLAAFIRDRIVTVEQITPQFIDGFTLFLREQKISPNSANLYRIRIVAALNRAVREGIIAANPAARASERIRTWATQRRFFTEDEMQRIAAIPCPNPEVGRAFLFACNTGLRISDVRALTWGDVRAGAVHIVQTKTRNEVVVPLNADAIRYLGERGDAADGDHVFTFNEYTSLISRVLHSWAKRAGIQPFTFHTSRHTYATRLLTAGADLYTVSKLLGHSDVRQTQIYGRIIDERKQAAVQALPALGAHLRLIDETDAA